MRLSIPDVLVLVIYFVAMIAVGVYVTRRASRNLDSYFLGGKSMPWWLLGISNASAMWDITGTMWFVYILYAYGMKAVFLPWVGPSSTRSSTPFISQNGLDDQTLARELNG